MFSEENNELLDKDEIFYKATAYNEVYYLVEDQESTRQSNLALELEELNEQYHQQTIA
jgi:hypothetical protein